MGRKPIQEVKNAEPVTLGGRRFLAVVESTLEHELYFLEVYNASGVSELTLREGEAPDDFSVRILDDLVASRKVLKILGALFVPEEVGVEGWTLDVAQDTARFLGKLKSREEKEKVKAILLELILDFFARGMVSFWRSPRSSDGGGHPQSESAVTGGAILTRAGVA